MLIIGVTFYKETIPMCLVLYVTQYRIKLRDTDLEEEYRLVEEIIAASFCKYTVLMAELISLQSLREL